MLNPFILILKENNVIKCEKGRNNNSFFKVGKINFQTLACTFKNLGHIKLYMAQACEIAI
jgi:hypothetical protein